MTRSAALRRFALTFPLLAFPLPGHTEEDDTPDCVVLSGGSCLTAEKLSPRLDYGAPTSPLFTLMNTTPESVVDPRASEKWSLLTPSLGALAKDDPVSLGLSVNPGLMLLGDRITRQDILSGGRQTKKSLLTNLSVQAAYIRNDADPIERQFGLGLSWTYDANAPLNVFKNYDRCASKYDFVVNLENRAVLIAKANYIATRGITSDTARIKMRQVIGQKMLITGERQNNAAIAKDLVTAAGKDASGNDLLTQKQAEAMVREILAIPELETKIVDIQEIGQTCLDKVLRWNRMIFSVGLAQYWSTLDGAPDRQGSGAWISYAFPLGEEAQGTVSGFWTDGLVRDSLLPDAADGTIDIVDSWGISGRYTHRIGKSGGAKITRGYLEAAYVSESFGTTEDDFYQLGLGAELAVQENVYMQIGYVDTLGSSLKDRGAEVNLGLNIAFSSASLFKGN